jgi:hypothetical protein
VCEYIYRMNVHLYGERLCLGLAKKESTIGEAKGPSTRTTSHQMNGINFYERNVNHCKLMRMAMQ